MFFIFILQAFWASSIPISKVLLGLMSPIFLAGIRMSIAGSFLLGYYYLYMRQHFTLTHKHWFAYAQIIFFGIYLKYLFRYWGLSHLPTAKMAFITNITPFLVALFSYLFLKEKLSKIQWLGLCIGFMGLMPVLLAKGSSMTLWGQHTTISWPEFAILAECGAHGYALVLMRNMVKNLGYSSGMANGIRMFGGGVLALITAYFVEGTAPLQCCDLLPFIGWLTILILLSNVICNNFYVYLMKYYTATFLSFTDFLSPIFVGIYGWFFLHETITWHYFASGGIVFAGLYLFYQHELSMTSLFPGFNVGLLRRTSN
jgi:drug/metabolite transporter (DMT)-like permease